MPIALENNKPLFLLLLIIFILESFFDKFFKTFNELSVEPSLIAIISMSFKVCFCILLMLLFKYFSLLKIGRNIDILCISFILFIFKIIFFLKYINKEKNKIKNIFFIL